LSSVNVAPNLIFISILNDINSLQTLYDKSEPAKILCGSNKGAAGVDNINQIVRNFLKNEHPETQNLIHYPSEIMMINKNNKLLDLYNGDTGVLIKFKNDSTLYFMLQKTSLLIEKDGYVQDKIFKIGKFVFYPLRMISKNEIDTAYAISIHKSQGSGYKNILVTLPSQKGHPLLNRQIIYTAITRTKGNTYIISNIDRLNEAKDTILKRDTNLR
jgi:exodeoxyribonuclease V alpha subunit